MKKYYFIIFIILLALPLIGQAAILYLEPSTGTYHQGDVFLIEARLDTKGEYINTADVKLTYSPDILEVKDISKGDSILTLWVEEPGFSNGVISFAGGLPGGYQGIDGLLAKIAFRARGTAQNSTRNYAELRFLDSSKVLLNDGKGTETGLITKGAVFDIKEVRLPEEVELQKDEWQEEIEKDKILPEPFKVEISQDPAIFDGKYFIIFSTTDKQTGIDHYEVKEGKRDWKTATSPYVLENQKLTDDIWVRAIDKAGNEWIEILEATREPAWKYTIYLIIVLSLIIIIIIRVIWWIIKRFITK